MTERNKIVAVVLTVAAGILLAVALPVDPGSQLSEDHLGRWYFAGSGGGISGEGMGGEIGSSIVITSDDRIERYSASGELIGTTRFTLSRGVSIYTGEEAWLLVTDDGMPHVIDLHADGSLSIADNVYDGFGTTYRRTR